MSAPNLASTQVLSSLLGDLPYRMALAGGWIDQPFLSRHNPAPPGAMLVVSLQPAFRFMDRSGMATSTRKVAKDLWGDHLPQRPPAELVRELYYAENGDSPRPSGSQDMAGMIYPGINRLDYDFNVAGGLFPAHVESCNDPGCIAWLERVLHILPVCPRPDGYDPLLVQHLDPAWIARLGRTGHDCFQAILQQDLPGLAAAMNATMQSWELLLPANFEHPSLTVPLLPLLHTYQKEFAGACYSSCGGGYLYVVSDQPVPGSFHPVIRSDPSAHA